MQVVAEKTSFLFLFSIVLTTGIIGLSLAKKQGKEHLLKVQQELAAGKIPGNPVVEGLMILVAAAVLITPGFLTDIIGFLFLVPFVRRLIAPRFVGLLKPKANGIGSMFFHFSSKSSFQESPSESSKPVVDAEFFDIPEAESKPEEKKRIED